jgi:hypothetical protein
LLVARRVGDNEATPWGREIAVGDVDGDALLALGAEAVEQKRIVDVLSLRSVAQRIRLERRQLILRDEAAFVEQAADQGRLAVVDAAAGDEAQQAQK